MRRNPLLTLAAALIAATIAASADAQARRPHYADLTPEQQAARVNAYADAIIAATGKTRQDRNIRFRNASSLKWASMDEKTDERGRKLAFEALIRAYEGQAQPGVTLQMIALAGQPLPPGWQLGDLVEGPGLDYVRHIFQTAELPPGPEERAEMGFYESGDLIRSPWCRAGLVLFGGIGGEVNEAYGIPKDRQRDLLVNPDTPKPDPPPQKLSEDAAKWWNRCWDGR